MKHTREISQPIEPPNVKTSYENLCRQVRKIGYGLGVIGVGTLTISSSATFLKHENAAECLLGFGLGFLIAGGDLLYETRGNRKNYHIQKRKNK